MPEGVTNVGATSTNRSTVETLVWEQNRLSTLTYTYINTYIYYRTFHLISYRTLLFNRSVSSRVALRHSRRIFNYSRNVYFIYLIKKKFFSFYQNFTKDRIVLFNYLILINFNYSNCCWIFNWILSCLLRILKKINK